VRHRGKIESAIHNAKQSLKLTERHGSLASFVWRFDPPAKERPLRVTKAAVVRLTETPTSQALSKALRAEGFSFVGPTTMYAFMQAMGLVNDHLEGCAARERALTGRAKFRCP
jgi:DNA-3-methyladenine glycosylase I